MSQRTKWLPATIWHIVLIASIILLNFPLIWAIVTSFKPRAEQFSVDFIADNPTLSNYSYAINNFPLFTQLTNTFMVAIFVSVGQIVVAALAAFSLTYYRPRWGKWFLVLVAFTLVVPAQAIMIPQFLLTAKLGWTNSIVGLTVPLIAHFAVALLLLYRAIGELPASQFEAARLDGAGAWAVFSSIVLRQMAPMMFAVGILTFISTWNEYLWPLLVASKPEDTVIQIGLQQFMGEGGNNYSGLMAAAVLAVLPILVVYLIGSRWVTEAFVQANRR